MEKLSNIILQKIKSYDKIICLHHKSPDGDAYGSSFGLANWIKENFPNKIVKVDGESVEGLDFLATHDKVSHEDYLDSLVIVTDTANTERISSEYWDLANEIIKIDHHPNDDPYGDIQYVDITKCAASQIVTELIFEWGMKISIKTARLLYAGIITDSGRFLYPSVDKDTLLVAARLLEIGVDKQEIYDNLYQDSLNNVLTKAELLRTLKISDNGVGYICVTKKMLNEFGLTYEAVKPWVNIMANIKEIKIWVLLIENEIENYINISIRSRSERINEVAKKYHGGGHALASGAKIYNWDELNNIINDLDTLLK